MKMRLKEKLTDRKINRQKINETIKKEWKRTLEINSTQNKNGRNNRRQKWIDEEEEKKKIRQASDKKNNSDKKRRQRQKEVEKRKKIYLIRECAD